MTRKISELFKFDKKIVVISGCSGQLGKELTEFFIKNNSIVYGIDKKKPLNKKINFIKCDIVNDKNLETVIKKIYLKEKSINIFINNAAISVFQNFEKRKLKNFKDTLSANLYAPFNVIKYLSKISKKKDKLKIINIASIYGVVTPNFKIYSKGDRFNSEIYGASKAALIQMTKYFGNLLSNKNICVNCVSPGGIKNINLQKKKFIRNYSKNVPKNRLAKTSDFLTVIAYLSSDYSGYTTGQNIVIDGGLSLK
jgi:NAD(P)-dependent dehydrogenase (short-subunit alcohol dehydrogenase family)